MRLSDDGPEFPDALVEGLERGDVVFLCGAGVMRATSQLCASYCAGYSKKASVAAASRGRPSRGETSSDDGGALSP